MDCKTCVFLQEQARGQKIDELNSVIKYQRDKYGSYMAITADNLKDILIGAGVTDAVKEQVLDYFNGSINHE